MLKVSVSKSGCPSTDGKLAAATHKKKGFKNVFSGKTSEKSDFDSGTFARPELTHLQEQVHLESCTL